LSRIKNIFEVYIIKEKMMNVLKDKCVAYFIEKRLLLDRIEMEEQKKRELLNNNMGVSGEIGINLEKYHYIVFGVILYMVLLFSIVR